MADSIGFWQRLHRLSKLLFIFLLVDICFLLVSLGLTAWSVSGFTDVLNFFNEVNSDSGYDPFYGTTYRTSSTSRRFSASISSRPTSSSSYWPGGSVYTSIAGSSASAGIGAASRSGSASGAASVTNIISGSAVASASAVLSRTALASGSIGSSVQFGKREGSSPGPTATSSSSYTTTTTTTARAPTIAAIPTSAPPSVSTGYHWSSDQLARPFKMQQKQLAAVAAAAGQRSKLQRRQRYVDRELLEEAIDLVKVFVALNSTILAILVVQILLCAVFFVVLCISHKSEEKTDYHKLQTSAKWFSILVGITSILILCLAIASVAYGSLKLLQSSGYLTLYIIFWILSAGIGVVLAVNANQLRKFSTVQLQSEPAPTTMTETG